MGLLKNTIDAGRAHCDLLTLSIETPSTATYRVLIDSFKLWLLAVSPGTVGSDWYFFNDLHDDYSAPAGTTKKRLPIGGSHAQLGTWTQKFTYDSFKQLDLLANYGGSVIADDSRERAALSLTVVAISEASRFRSIMQQTEEVLARRRTVVGSDLKNTINNWKKNSGCEGAFPDVRIHHRPGKSPCERN